MYDTSLNQKSNSNSNAKIATLKHSSKELERYRISIVFGYSCIAKIISNAHLIRSVQLNFNKNRKLINQIFKYGFMRCFSRCFFFSCCLVWIVNLKQKKILFHFIMSNRAQSASKCLCFFFISFDKLAFNKWRHSWFHELKFFCTHAMNNIVNEIVHKLKRILMVFFNWIWS